AEDGIRDKLVTGVQTCALPIYMDRQSILERMGWVFTRVRSSDFLRNPARAMKSIFEKLQVMEIPPDGNTRDGKLDAKISHDVTRSEEHTSELQSLAYLVCRLLL